MTGADGYAERVAALSMIEPLADRPHVISLGAAKAYDPHDSVDELRSVNARNSSATFQFADKARAAGLVRLFGETTGGNQRGINGGCFFFVRLPASGIEFDLPLIGYFPPGHPPDAGLAPDVTVKLTAADLAKSYDRPLETAASWILG